MLHAHKISIKNFRSIENEAFTLPALSVLVGKNDVGKSNLLEAIRILFEGSTSDIGPEDFYDTEKPIELAAELHGVREYLDLCDERNRSKLDERINEQGVLVVRRTATSSPKRLGEIELLHPATGQFSTPTGIDAAMKPMMPEVIYIEALADVADETKGTQKDTLGKLVAQVISDVVRRVAPKLEEAYVEADKLLNVQVTTTGEKDTRAPELIEIESEVTNYLHETFPAAGVRLKIQLASVKDLISQTEVLVKEGDNIDPYFRRGHGLQRNLYLSLLRALAARIREGQKLSRPLMVLFEEPEAFLHPDGQIKMRNALLAISEEAQVVLATHSPIMVTPASLPNTIRLEKKAEEGLPKPVTKRFGPVSNSELSDVQQQLLPLFGIQRSSRFLFSRGVLLVEGVGDEHIFPAVASRLKNFDLETVEVSIVEAGGKDHLIVFSQILQKLGLRTWVLTDLDFLWRGAGQVLGVDASYAQFMQKLNELVPTPAGHLDDSARYTLKQDRIRVCCADLASQRDDLCKRLADQGVFVLRHGETENYVGLSRTSKGKYVRAAEEIRAGKRSIEHQDELISILESLRAGALS